MSQTTNHQVFPGFEAPGIVRVEALTTTGIHTSPGDAEAIDLELAMSDQDGTGVRVERDAVSNALIFWAESERSMGDDTTALWLGVTIYDAISRLRETTDHDIGDLRTIKGMATEDIGGVAVGAALMEGHDISEEVVMLVRDRQSGQEML